MIIETTSFGGSLKNTVYPQFLLKSTAGSTPLHSLHILFIVAFQLFTWTTAWRNSRISSTPVSSTKFSIALSRTSSCDFSHLTCIASIMITTRNQSKSDRHSFLGIIHQKIKDCFVLRTFQGFILLSFLDYNLLILILQNLIYHYK